MSLFTMLIYWIITQAIGWNLGHCQVSSTVTPTTAPISPTTTTFQPPTTTAFPTMSPIAAPTMAPTNTYCPAEYIFPNATHDSLITIPCPFGYLGDNATAVCERDGHWKILYDGCSIISFTDDFSTIRNDLWKVQSCDNCKNKIWDTTNGYLLALFDVDISSYSKIYGPKRIEYQVISPPDGCYSHTITFAANATRYSYYDTYMAVRCYYFWVQYNGNDENGGNTYFSTYQNVTRYDGLWLEIYGNGYDDFNSLTTGLVESRFGDGHSHQLDPNYYFSDKNYMRIYTYDYASTARRRMGWVIEEGAVTFDTFRLTTFVDNFGPIDSLYYWAWTGGSYDYDYMCRGVSTWRSLSALWTNYCNVTNTGLMLSTWLQNRAHNSNILAGSYNHINVIKFNSTAGQQSLPFLQSDKSRFQFQTPYVVRGVFLWPSLWNNMIGNNGSIQVEVSTVDGMTLTMECRQQILNLTYVQTLVVSWIDGSAKPYSQEVIFTNCSHPDWFYSSEKIMLQFDINISDTAAEINISNPFYHNQTLTCAKLTIQKTSVPSFSQASRKWDLLTIKSGSIPGPTWLTYIDAFQGIPLPEPIISETTEAPINNKEDDDSFYDAVGGLEWFIAIIVGVAACCGGTVMTAYCFVFKRKRLTEKDNNNNKDQEGNESRKNTTIAPGSDGETGERPKNPLNQQTLLNRLESENELYEQTNLVRVPSSPKQNNPNMVAMMQTGAPGSPLQLVQLIPVNAGNESRLNPKSVDAQITAQPTSLFESFQKQQQLAAQGQRAQSPPKLPPRPNLPPQPKVELTAGLPVRLQSDSFDNEPDDVVIPDSSAPGYSNQTNSNMSPRKQDNKSIPKKRAFSEEEEGGSRPEYLLEDVQACVDINGLVGMSPIGEDGQRRLDANRSKILLAKYRGVAPTQIQNNDSGIPFLVDLTLVECKQLLASCPTHVADAIRGKKSERKLGERKSTVQDQDAEELYDSIKVNFLTMFTERCNIKQVYTKLASETKNRDPVLDVRHARIFISNLRDITFAQVTETDPGVLMLVGKTMTELREMLSNIELDKVRLLDLKSYYAMQNQAANSAFVEGENFNKPQDWN